jgi:PAS domain S-box-containing protein
MDNDRDEEILLRSVAMQNANSIRLARLRAEQELTASKEALERKTEELTQANRQLLFLNKITNGLVFGEGTLKELKWAFEAVAGEVGAKYYFYHRAGEHQPGILVLELWSGQGHSEEHKFRQTTPNLSDEVARTRLPLAVENLNLRSDEATSAMRALGIKAYVGLPLVAHGRLFGTIAFGSVSKTLFTAPDIALLKTLTDQFAAILDRTDLLASLREREERLRIDVVKRKEIEESLRISEARYRSVVEGSLQGIVIQQAGRIVYANPAMASLFGYSGPTEMIGLSTFDDLVHKDDQPVLRARTAAVYKGEKVVPHPGWRAHHKNGKMLWVSSTATLSEWQGSPAVTSFYFDITEEKLAREHLKESELAYRRALKAARSGAFEWDIVNDRVTWSEETGELLKVKPSEYPRTLAEFLTFLPDEERPQMAAGIQQRLEGISEAYEIENRLRRGDGTFLWVRGSGRIERDGSGKPIRLTGLVSDIDELRHARDAVIVAAARSRLILDTVPAFVGTLTPEGILSEINATAIAMSGLQRDEVVGKPFPDCYWWNYSSEVQEQLHISMQRAVAGESVRYDVNIRIANDQIITVDFQLAPNFDMNGNVIELVASAVDITERKRAEEAVRESEERHRILFAAAPMAVFVCDRNAVIQYYNSRAVELWGREPARGIEQHCGSVKLWLPDGTHLPHGQSPIVEVLHSGIPAFNVEVFVERPDGTRLPVLANFAALKSAQGEITGAVTSFTDITERKRVEEHIKYLLGEVNHRAKNLLTVVQAIARQTARSGDPSTMVTRLSERISGLAANQDLLVRNEWQGIELSDLVEAQLAHFKDVIGSRVLLDGPSVRVVPAAAQGIGLALHELATNASKYGALSNNNGKVRISWHVTGPEEPMFSLHWVEEGGPKVIVPTHGGFGRTVIGPMAEAAVHGTAQIEYRESGLSWKLIAPADSALELGRPGRDARP